MRTLGVFNWARFSDQKLMEQEYVFLSALNAWAHFASSKVSRFAEPVPMLFGASRLMPAKASCSMVLDTQACTSERRLALHWSVLTCEPPPPVMAIAAAGAPPPRGAPPPLVERCLLVDSAGAQCNAGERTSGRLSLTQRAINDMFCPALVCAALSAQLSCCAYWSALSALLCPICSALFLP